MDLDPVVDERWARLVEQHWDHQRALEQPSRRALPSTTRRWTLAYVGVLCAGTGLLMAARLGTELADQHPGPADPVGNVWAFLFVVFLTTILLLAAGAFVEATRGSSGLARAVGRGTALLLAGVLLLCGTACWVAVAR